MKKSQWRVRLGDREWSRFTYGRSEGDALRLLGSIERGPQIGALAVTQNGQYVQVVGDFVTALNRSQVDKAVAKAQANAQHAFRKPAPAQASAPVVIVKRRRLVPPALRHFE